MAGIVLKDGNGNEIEYAGVGRIQVNERDYEGRIVPIKFHRLAYLYPYAIKQNGSVGDIATYAVLKRMQYIGAGDWYIMGFSEEEYQSLGGDGITLLFTTKTLTEGQTYPATELY